MIENKNITIEGKEFYTVSVKLPKTTLLVVGNERGYFMCGALDVAIFDSKPHLQARKVICGRALGVKTLEQLIEAPLETTTLAAKEIGICEGVKVSDALLML